MQWRQFRCSRAKPVVMFQQKPSDTSGERYSVTRASILLDDSGASTPSRYVVRWVSVGPVNPSGNRLALSIRRNTGTRMKQICIDIISFLCRYLENVLGFTLENCIRDSAQLHRIPWQQFLWPAHLFELSHPRTRLLRFPWCAKRRAQKLAKTLKL